MGLFGRKVTVALPRGLVVDAEQALRSISDPVVVEDADECRELTDILAGCLRQVSVGLQGQSPVLAQAVRIAAYHYEDQADALARTRSAEALAVA